MLHILTGRAGSGKTKEIYLRMAQNGKGRPQLLLVPEQASFEAEQRLCRENGNQAGLYGEVLTFTRLENRVLSLSGGGARPVLDQGGRLLVMYAALRSVAPKLTVYALPSRKPEFLNSLLTTADELKSCCVTGTDLIRAGEETGGLDGDKLRDLGLIFGAYDAMTARGSLDPRDRLTRLAEKLRDTPYCEGKDLYIDGFTDFTPQQRLVLERLLAQAYSVTVTLSMEPGRGEDEVFAPARRTAAILKRLAEKVRCPVTEEHIGAAARNRTEPLRHLEGNLFGDMELYEGPWDGSIITAALPSPRDEVRWAAGVIRDLAKAGYRFRDIMLTARSIEGYREHIREVFSEFEIPVFQSERTDILQKPVFTLITAALDAAAGGYDYEDMFRYLKTGLAGLTPDQCDRLENYVRTWDLRGSRWTGKKDWTMHPAGYSGKWTEEDRALLTELNALRRQVAEPLEKLRKTAGDTIRSQCMALYAFLESIGAPDALEARSRQLLEEGEPERSREYAQLWEIFCHALEQCAAMVGDLEEDFSDFSRLLKLLFSRYSVGTIPASLDRVTAGDARRLSNRACKVLLFLGADDSSIPLIAPEQGLLTDRDREALEGFGLEVRLSPEEKLSWENLIVYAACTQPTEKLYVSWPTGGGEKRPSFLAERLSYLFPESVTRPEPPASPDRLLTLAAKDRQARALLEERYHDAFRRLDRAAGWERGKLSPQAVRSLYKEKVSMSASRMDRFKSCHFAYFLQYGLKAEPRRRAGFDAPVYGTFVHYILEHVLKDAKERGGVKNCSDEDIRAMTRQAVTDYVSTQLGGMEHQTPRFRYLFRRLQAGVQAVVDNVVEELRSSDFQPIFFELGFGEKTDLPPVELRAEGVTLRISGFVDRVDGWEKDGRLYLRVVDYKTGRKSFDLTEIWNGMGLQMLLYLFTLEEKGEKLLGQAPVPAGVLYLPARDALISGSRAMEETELRALMDRELERKGLVLAESDVIGAMEEGENGFRFLPLKVSKRTGIISGDALVTAERLGRLRRHTKHILEDICREIAAGNIDADPFWRGAAKNACLYCDYAQVCQFEEGKDRRRWLPTLGAEEFWTGLEEQEEKGGEDRGSEAYA